MSRVLAATAAAALAAVIALAAPSGGRSATACGSTAYSYAGVLSLVSRFGVGATIRSLAPPLVRGGHVAAWVGVGGEGEGPGGSSEWLQAGLSAEPGRGVALYYELALPGVAQRYVMLKGHLPAGRSYRISVLESRQQPGSWRVRVNGTSVTRSIHLPGSHGAWRPVATTESWAGGDGACNSYSFRFSNVAVAGQPGGSWSPMRSLVIDQPGFRVKRVGHSGFVASGGV